MALRFSLRWRLIFLVLLAAVPALVLTIYSAGEQRRRAASDAAQEALRIARLGAAMQERLAEGARQLLTALAQLPEVRGDDPQACSELLARLREQYHMRRDGELEELYANLGVVEIDGNLFASALPSEGPIYLGDRPYFQRAIETGTFSIGDYQVGRVTGKPTVNFGLPVFGDSARVTRVVYAALDLEWIYRLVDEAGLPEGASMTLLDRNGTILLRYPENMEWGGRSKIEAPLGRRIMSARREGVIEAGGLDGVRRLYAYLPIGTRRNPEFAYLAVGIPLGHAVAEADRQERRNLMTLCVVAVMTMGAAWVGGEWFLLRRVRALLRATKRLALGDLSARSGVGHNSDEIGELAHTFDQMAATLERRTVERKDAEEQLKHLNERLEERVVDRTKELQDRNEQMEDEIKLAREIQQAMLPQQYPTFPGNAPPGESALQFFHRYIPTGAVGGDFFTVLRLSDTQAGVFVCDVMGHGPRSALVTAMVRALIEELAPWAGDPGVLLSRLNREFKAILSQSGSPVFATAFYLVADIAAGKMLIARAGHPNPIHVRRHAGKVEAMVSPPDKRGPALGLFDGSIYPTSERALEEGDLVLLFTDGVFEVVGGDDQDFGEEHLRESIQRRMNLRAPALLDELLSEIRAFAGGEHFEDDICILAMEVARLPEVREAEGTAKGVKVTG